MKKFIVLATIVAMLSFSMLAYASEDEYPTYDQTASAILDQGGAEVKVIVDVTNGWSVEFARGAVYLYTEGVDPFDTTTEAVAMGLTLDEEVFKEYMEEAQASDSYKEYAQSFSYTEEDGSVDYFFSVGPDAYFMISVLDDSVDPDIVSSRFSILPAEKITEDQLVDLVDTLDTEE